MGENLGAKQNEEVRENPDPYVRNLMLETIYVLSLNHYSEDDVVQVQDDENTCSWEKFKELANKEYYAGFGCEEVLLSLKVVLKDGSWLERTGYDGAEKWVLRKPVVPLPANDKLDDVFDEWYYLQKEGNDE